MVAVLWKPGCRVLLQVADIAFRLLSCEEPVQRGDALGIRRVFDHAEFRAVLRRRQALRPTHGRIGAAGVAAGVALVSQSSVTAVAPGPRSNTAGAGPSERKMARPCALWPVTTRRMGRGMVVS
jgi:hypothetical protein